MQGHVDGTGRIVSRTPARHWEVVRITLPYGLARYVAEKGSVAVDGVSLTVSGVSHAIAAPTAPTAIPAAAGRRKSGGRNRSADEPWFEVSLIPVTLELTTLGRKQPGETVNLEVDVVAKYVEKLLDGSQR